MAQHTLQRKLTVQLPRPEVFDFFADARNLERITPPQLNFRIVSESPIDMFAGALIDYELRLRGVPIRWRTEISVWDPPFRFVDRQLKGPYSQWVHTHTFHEAGPDSTLIEDVVEYRLPFEPLGDLGHFIVARELKNIFDFRAEAVKEAFAGGAA